MWGGVVLRQESRIIFYCLSLEDVLEGIADFTGAWFRDGDEISLRTLGSLDCHLTGQFDLA